MVSCTTLTFSIASCFVDKKEEHVLILVFPVSCSNSHWHHFAVSLTCSSQWQKPPNSSSISSKFWMVGCTTLAFFTASCFVDEKEDTFQHSLFSFPNSHCSRSKHLWCDFDPHWVYDCLLIRIIFRSFAQKFTKESRCALSHYFL